MCLLTVSRVMSGSNLALFGRSLLLRIIFLSNALGKRFCEMSDVPAVARPQSGKRNVIAIDHIVSTYNSTGDEGIRIESDIASSSKRSDATTAKD